MSGRVLVIGAVNVDLVVAAELLHGPGGAVETVELKPRVAGFDFPLLRSLARRGVGITLLPENLCASLVHAGELEVVLPDWRLPDGICHAVFASRRGLLPAVRVFIDFLAERMPPMLEAARVECCEKNAGKRRPVAG